ncbi:hypothetical protein COV11_00105, partial [Candidatus Woesearchaeota archaeon CG10_big_fil_rev_8_21_14_0_10_30_7]
MNRIKTHDGETFITLPNDRLMVYLGFDARTNVKLFKDFERMDLYSQFNLRPVICKNLDIHVSDERVLYSGRKDSEGLFWLEHEFYRGNINPDKIIESEGLEQYLQSDNEVDFNHPKVQEIAKKIRLSIHPKIRKNPYFLAKKTIEWLNKNIEYVIVPERMIEELTMVISSLDDKSDIKKILDPFDFDKESIDRCVEEIELDPTAQPREIAKDLMLECDELFSDLYRFWPEYGDNLSASTTLTNKASKCVGFANSYVAIMRNFGVPSVQIIGFYSGELHNWAKSYFNPYGWVEVETTGDVFEEFDHEAYHYPFLYPKRKNLNVGFIGEGENNKYLRRAIKLVKEAIPSCKDKKKLLCFLA